MKIGLVTTWGANCGISTYSEQLAVALQDAGYEVHVFAPHDGSTNERAAPEVASVQMKWERENPDCAGYLRDALRARGVDHVHIQHEWGLFKYTPYATRQFLAELGYEPRKMSLTLHTVEPDAVLAYDWSDLARLVVHTPLAAAAMTRVGYTPIVIPHGTPYTDMLLANVRQHRIGGRSAQQRRELLGSIDPTQPVGLSIGFVSRGKNVENTLRMVAANNKQHIIAGRCDPSYALYLDNIIKHLGLERRVKVYDKFLNGKELSDVLTAVDYIVLNTMSSTCSSSGQVHMAAAAGVPIIAADRPIYHDATVAGALRFPVSQQTPNIPSHEAHTVFRTFAKDTLAGYQLRSQIATEMRAYASRTSWQKLVKNYYRRLYG